MSHVSHVSRWMMWNPLTLEKVGSTVSKEWPTFSLVSLFFLPQSSHFTRMTHLFSASEDLIHFFIYFTWFGFGASIQWGLMLRMLALPGPNKSTPDADWHWDEFRSACCLWLWQLYRARLQIWLGATWFGDATWNNSLSLSLSRIYFISACVYIYIYIFFF